MKNTISVTLMHEDYHFPFPVERKKNTRESNMLIDISRRESVISPLLLVVVLCGYISDISVSETGLRFI